MKSEGEGEHRTLVFRLDTDDLVMAGADHPLSFGGDADNPDPRLHVRGTIGNGLEAPIGRALYYGIVEMALAEGGEPPGIWSNGARVAPGDAWCFRRKCTMRPTIRSPITRKIDGY